MPMDQASALYNQAVIFHNSNHLPEAIELYHQALSLDPHFPEALSNLGTIYQNQGRLQEAQQLYQTALTHHPHFYPARNNLGALLRDLGDFSGAIDQYTASLNDHPDNPDAYNNLGVALQNLNRLPKAIQAYQNAIRLNSSAINPYINLGSVLQEIGDSESAVTAYQQALEIDPDSITALSHLVHQLQQTCQWSLVEQHKIHLITLVKRQIAQHLPAQLDPLISIAMINDPLFNMQVAKSWSQAILRRVSALRPNFHFSHLTHSTPLHIGYLNDFRDAPVFQLISGLFSAHDRRRFKISAFSFGPGPNSRNRDIVKKTSTAFSTSAV